VISLFGCYHGNADPLLFAASVDYETDKKIQDTIASEFEDRTILCIARKFSVSRSESENETL
jgi:ABC-type transport system involved in cytochrome bd biosynthesis fused ATPase/permease subunit